MFGDRAQPNAIIRLQRVKDVPSTHSGATATINKYDCAVSAAGVMSSVATDYWPLALYDTREGVRRDEAGSSTANKLYPMGAMYYVELDTANLAKWFKGTLAGVGTQAKNDNGGDIVYFSDRRNNRNSTGANADPRFANNAETGEFGYEDIINSSSASGAESGGTPEAGRRRERR